MNSFIFPLALSRPVRAKMILNSKSHSCFLKLWVQFWGHSRLSVCQPVSLSDCLSPSHTLWEIDCSKTLVPMLLPPSRVAPCRVLVPSHLVCILRLWTAACNLYIVVTYPQIPFSFLQLGSQLGQGLSWGRLTESLLFVTRHLGNGLGWCTCVNQQQPLIHRALQKNFQKSDRDLRLQSRDSHLGTVLWWSVASNCNIPSTW